MLLAFTINGLGVAVIILALPVVMALDASATGGVNWVRLVKSYRAIIYPLWTQFKLLD